MRLLMLCFGVTLAVPAQPVIGNAGYSFPVPAYVAPGQVVTLFVQVSSTKLTAPVRAPGPTWPTTLGGVTVTYRQGSDQAAAILEVRPISTCLGVSPATGSTCNTLLSITAQMPFNMLTLCPLCGRVDIPAFILVTVDGVASPMFSAQPLSDQVHILTACDALIPDSTPRQFAIAGPCPPMVTHVDGKLVSATNPASSGEELVAYAVGLGQTDPPSTLGTPVYQAALATAAFAIDFDYHVNATASQPLGPSLIGPNSNFPKPLFAGATPGYVGLYQFNFIVPPSPPGLTPCDDFTVLPPYASAVRSNLTVSFGSVFSFDGAGICVKP